MTATNSNSGSSSNSSSAKPIRELNPTFLKSTSDKGQLTSYLLGVADNYLILAQRLGELCGHGPNLEPDIAITNIALDLLGQVRSFYQYISQIAGDGTTEDDIAFLRKERDYRNVLLVEQPNTDFGYVIVRQYFFDVYNHMFLTALQQSKDETLSALAFKGIKEAAYHQRFSGDWLKRLGDGTEESHQRVQNAVNDLYVFTAELFDMSEADETVVASGIGVDTASFRESYYNTVNGLLETATLEVPSPEFWQRGGKKGLHSEHMGYLLAEMQFMQLRYPSMKW
jgi:ring-1,2-phenylacetyl-CoA epoxidase subunit PaaC